MILPKSSDLLTIGFCPASKLRLAFAEVTDSARALEQSHLCGPTATLALAEALAGVSLLIVDLEAAEETVGLRLQMSGPLQGLLVEAAADGSLRGYTNVKVINALDGHEDIDLNAAMGDRAEVQIMRSAPGRLLGRAAFGISPVSVRAAIEEYFIHSLQRPATVQITALAYDGYIDLARGVVVECMPDGDQETFARVVNLVSDGTALETLETCLSAREWCETMGLGEVRLETPRPLAFRCRCTRERVEDAVRALSVAELSEMLREKRAAQVYCHMCGKGYEVPPDRLEALVEEKRKGEADEH